MRALTDPLLAVALLCGVFAVFVLTLVSSFGPLGYGTSFVMVSLFSYAVLAALRALFSR